MKKLFSLILILPLLLLGCKEDTNDNIQNLSNNKPYFLFSQTCPHCHAAMEYINQKYPNLNISLVDVNTPEGNKLLWKTAEKYNLGDRIGVPLIALGPNHLMGWSHEYETRFDEFIKPFIK